MMRGVGDGASFPTVLGILLSDWALFEGDRGEVTLEGASEKELILGPRASIGVPDRIKKGLAGLLRMFCDCFRHFPGSKLRRDELHLARTRFGRLWPTRGRGPLSLLHIS